MEPPILYARFRTPEHFYIYDTYSNQIFDTPKGVWEQFDRAVAETRNAPQPVDASSADLDLQNARTELQKAQAAGAAL